MAAEDERALLNGRIGQNGTGPRRGRHPAALWPWRRRPQLRYITLGLACCAVELMPLVLDRYRPDRFGIIPARWSEDADVLVVAGAITEKFAPVVAEVYRAMPPHRRVIAVSACASKAGPYHQGATLVDGVDRVIPVDIYVPGCPPRPEAVVRALLEAQMLKARGGRTRSRAVVMHTGGRPGS